VSTYKETTIKMEKPEMERNGLYID